MVHGSIRPFGVCGVTAPISVEIRSGPSPERTLSEFTQRWWEVDGLTPPSRCRGP